MKWSSNFRLGYAILPIAVLSMLLILQISTSSPLVADPSSGELWTWGANSSSQLNSNIPVHVSSMDGVIKIAASDEHVVVLKSDGTVWAWGRNLSGQLGNGTNIDSNVPVQVIGLTEVVDIDASAG